MLSLSSLEHAQHTYECNKKHLGCLLLRCASRCAHTQASRLTNPHSSPRQFGSHTQHRCDASIRPFCYAAAGKVSHSPLVTPVRPARAEPYGDVWPVPLPPTPAAAPSPHAALEPAGLPTTLATLGPLAPGLVAALTRLALEEACRRFRSVLSSLLLLLGLLSPDGLLLMADSAVDVPRDACRTVAVSPQTAAGVKLLLL